MSHGRRSQRSGEGSTIASFLTPTETETQVLSPCCRVVAVPTLRRPAPLSSIASLESAGFLAALPLLVHPNILEPLSGGDAVQHELMAEDARARRVVVRGAGRFVMLAADMRNRAAGAAGPARSADSRRRGAGAAGGR